MCQLKNHNRLKGHIVKLPDCNSHIGVKNFVEFRDGRVLAKITVFGTGVEEPSSFFPTDYIQLRNAQSRTPQRFWRSIKLAAIDLQPTDSQPIDS